MMPAPLHIPIADPGVPGSTKPHMLVQRLVDLSITRGGVTLASGISLDLYAGTYVEIHGANGSGKTSLLRILAQVQPPLCASMLQTLVPAFHFAQGTAFRDELSVATQLALALALYGAAHDAARVAGLLARTGLAAHASEPVGRLSQGQQRRLLLAVMIACGCPLWLIDEPFNALDQQAIALFSDALDAHLRGGGAAVIATHRPLRQVLPELAGFGAGTLLLDGKASHYSPALRCPPSTGSLPASTVSALHDWRALSWVMRREWALVTTRPQDAVWPAVFHWMVVSLFPFGLGSDPALLATVAPGVFWVSALLAILIGAPRFIEADFKHGVLDACGSAGLSLSTLATGKLLASWLLAGVPLALASLPLGLQYGLDAATLAVLFLSLLAGTLSLAALSGLYAALGLMARQAQIVICLLALPVFVPLLIFGAAAVGAVRSGLSPTAPLLVLASIAVVALLALPAATGRVLALAIE